MSGNVTTPDSLWTALRQTRSDTPFMAFVALCLLSNVPLLPLADTPDRKEVYVWLQTVLVFLPGLILFVWPRPGEPQARNERVFWLTLASAFLLWWLSGVVNLLIALGFLGSEVDLATDLNYLFYYLAWLGALGQQPHRMPCRRRSSMESWLMGAGTIGLALCLFFYFILLPKQLRPDIYASWVPSYLFYTGLDFFVVLLLLRLYNDAIGPRWRAIYVMLITGQAATLILDYLDALNYTVDLAWAGSILVDMLWTLPFAAFALAARARRYTYPDSAAEPEAQAAAADNSWFLTSPIVLVAFFLLIMHVLLEQLGPARDQLREAQGAIVVIGLVLFLTLALLENRALHRVAQTARARAEALEKQRIRQQVETRSQQAKSQFLANVSHELRTPMNGVLGMSEILLAGELEPEQRRRAELIHASADSLLEIIDDILEYSRLEAGGIALLHEAFDPRAVARQAESLARVALGRKPVELDLQFAADLPTALLGDPARLRQVLLNLLDNAVKFTERGQIRLRFTATDIPTGQVRLHCEVADTGIGIAPDIADRLFLPFSQGDASATRRHGGSGLGLAIVRQIVEAQSGSVGYRDNAGGGAVFWFEMSYRIAGNGTDAAGSPQQRHPPPDGKRASPC